MSVFNLADAIRVGDDDATAVYYGDVLLWSPPGVSYSDVVAVDIPTLYLPFQESSNVGGEAHDPFSDYYADRTGTPVLGSPPILVGDDYSTTFDGSGFWYTAPNAAGNPTETTFDVGTGDFGYEFWILSDLATGSYYDVMNRDYNDLGNAVAVYVNNSDGVVRVWCGGVPLNGNIRITDDMLHHVVITRESGTLKIYVDGVLDASTSAPGNLNAYTARLQIGGGGGTNPISSTSMAHFAYYMHALDSSRVSAHYLAGTRFRITTMNGDYLVTGSGDHLIGFGV